jgi:hypothetical protein
MTFITNFAARRSVLATGLQSAKLRRRQFSGLTPTARQKSVRRGVAVLLVLGMLAMTLALSYASLRGQATVAQLAENQGRGEEARLAAESGIYTALRKMSDGTWAGADTSFSGNVSDHSWYEVSFVTGDALLTPADSSYGEFAYRVTIASTGYSSDPSQPAVRAIHKVDAIVQLARRTILAEPATWADLEPYAVHQWANRQIYTHFPVRIQGPTQIRGALHLANEYPLVSEPEKRYLQDLKAKRDDGGPDHRPFAGPLTIAFSKQSTATMTQLQTDLGLTLADTTASNTSPVAHPGPVVSYRLYPGGKAYTAPILQDEYGSALENVTLEPDPTTNPLGIYRNRNSIDVNDNVRIRGTIIGEGTTSDIQVYGANVSLEPVNLAPLEGSSQTYQLPVAILRDDIDIHDTSDATISGLLMCYDEFEIRSGSKNAQFQFNGQLMAAGLAVRGREEFALLGSLEWTTQHALFLLQFDPLVPTATRYFPEWMEDQVNLPEEPRLRFTRDTSGVKYHWHPWGTQAVYQKDPADPGLRWNLVRWVEGS